jgi:hypothetical protein
MPQPPSAVPEADNPHLLRFCLDLKLDALLLSLGAAASDPTCLPPDLAAGTRAADAPAAVSFERLIDLTTDPPSTRVVRHPDAGDTPDGDPPDDAGSVTVPVAGPVTVPVAVPVAGPVAVPTPPWRRWLHEDVEATRALSRELVNVGGALPSPFGLAGSPEEAIAVLDRLEAFHVEIRTLLEEAEAVATGMAAGLPDGVGPIPTVLRHCRRRLTELSLLRVQVAALQAAEPAMAPTALNTLPGEFLG